MPDEYRAVVGGVDTHRDTHTAAAVDSTGRLLGTATFPATRAGYEELWGWLRGLGSVERVGVEGTSSYGAGLSRHLAAHDVTVIEVLRPKRRARRGHKCDPADAEAAARAVLSGEAVACPKSADGPVEAIRMLRAARRSAVKARTAAINQLKGLLVTASEQVAAPLRGLFAPLRWSTPAPGCGPIPAAARPPPRPRGRFASSLRAGALSAPRSKNSTPRSHDCARRPPPR